MTFAQPLFLFALAAIAIPVIIHLFNFRRYKKIWFTNVRYIAEITQETKKRNELKHLLILAARILAISAIVFAFALPYIPSPLQKRTTAGISCISVFVDNSFSMEAIGKDGMLLDEAKQKAIAIANASEPSDLFQLMTCDMEGKHQRFVSRDDFIRMINEIKISPAVLPVSEAMKRQAEFLASCGSKDPSGYLISDFQKSISVLPADPDTLVSWFFIPVAAGAANNLYIDSIWFDTPAQQPSQPLKMNVSVRNSSAESFEKIPLKMTINGVQKAVSGFTIDPYGETKVIMSFTNDISGVQKGVLEITDYPVTWDDAFYFSYNITPAIPILCISENEGNPYLQALFGEDSAFIFRTVNIRQPDYSAFSRYSLIILDGVVNYSTGLIQELRRFMTGGGTVLVMPAENTDPVTLNSLLASSGINQIGKMDTARLRVSYVNTSNQLFDDVFEKRTLPENADLPMVLKHFTSQKTSTSPAEELMKLQNGDVFLSVSNSGKGKIYMLYSPLEETAGNFPKNSIFVPVMYKIALLSQPMIDVYSTLSVNEGIPLPADTLRNQEVYRIRKDDADLEIIPEIRRTEQNVMLYPHDQIKEAGNYSVFAGKQLVRPVSFNYDRKESDLTYTSSTDLERMINRAGIVKSAILKGKTENLGKQIKDLSKGTPLWKYFIIAGLAFLLAEILLVRLLKE